MPQATCSDPAICSCSLPDWHLTHPNYSHPALSTPSSLFLMFVLAHFDMISGGALGSLAAGMAAAALWQRGWPHAAALSLGPAPAFADDLDECISLVWDW